MSSASESHGQPNHLACHVNGTKFEIGEIGEIGEI
jgi:hypothetical protein